MALKTKSRGRSKGECKWAEMGAKSEHALPLGSTEVVGLATTGQYGEEGWSESWHSAGGLYMYFPVRP